jgi:hypothetical protein
VGAKPQGRRAARGATRWGVVLIHFPPSVDCRYQGEVAARHRECSQVDEAGGQQSHRQRQQDLPTLRGDAHEDELLLRGMRPTHVRDMERWWASLGELASARAGPLSIPGSQVTGGLEGEGRAGQQPVPTL